MPADIGFVRALTEISPDLAKQYLRQYHPTEVLEEVLEPKPPEPEAKPTSTVEERNSEWLRAFCAMRCATRRANEKRLVRLFWRLSKFH